MQSACSWVSPRIPIGDKSRTLCLPSFFQDSLEADVNNESCNDYQSIKAMELGFEEPVVEFSNDEASGNLGITKTLPRAKCPYTREQFDHEEATKNQTHDPQSILRFQ